MQRNYNYSEILGFFTFLADLAYSAPLRRATWCPDGGFPSSPRGFGLLYFRVVGPHVNSWIMALRWQWLPTSKSKNTFQLWSLQIFLQIVLACDCLRNNIIHFLINYPLTPKKESGYFGHLIQNYIFWWFHIVRNIEESLKVDHTSVTKICLSIWMSNTGKASISGCCRSVLPKNL